MAKALAFLLVVSCFQTCPGERQESWFSQDKVLHLTVSAMLVSTVYHLHQHHDGDSRSSSEVFASQVTLCLSVGKEMSDDQFSYRDLMVDLVGIAVGLVLFVR